MADSDSPQVDVRELMREVQRRAQHAPIVGAPVEVGSATSPALHANLDLLRVPLESHRVGVGWMIAHVKSTLARLLRPVLHRQTLFNAEVIRGLAETQARWRQLDSQLSEVEVRLVRAERRLREAESAPGSTDAALGAAPVGLVPHAPAEADWARAEMQRRFRGSEEEIKQRQRIYLHHFQKVGGPVLDLGCGRGEFLELAREIDVAARGLELDADNIERCRDKRLDVVHTDIFDYLEQTPDGSLGGVFCAQVIEHLPPPQMVRLVNLVASKLRRQGVALFETPNPQCLTIFARAYYLDFTHVWPYHPEIARATLELAGFDDVQVVFSSPVNPDARLPQVPDSSLFGPATDAYHRAAEIINELLLGPQDYAVIGWRRRE